MTTQLTTNGNEVGKVRILGVLVVGRVLDPSREVLEQEEKPQVSMDNVTFSSLSGPHTGSERRPKEDEDDGSHNQRSDSSVDTLHGVDFLASSCFLEEKGHIFH